MSHTSNDTRRLPDRSPLGERGAALVAATLVLLLVSILAVTFMSTITGERAQSSGVHVAKGSLYAADAGVRTSQQMLANLAWARLDTLIALYPGSGPVIAQPGSFFPAGQVSGSATDPAYNTTTTIAFSNDSIGQQAQAYNFRYSITSTGRYGSHGERMVQSDGMLRVSVFRGNFTDYLVFTNHHVMGNGGNIWFTSSGYFDGPVHTNEKVRIAYRPTFEDLLSSVNQMAQYYNIDDPIDLDADHNGTIDVPNLHGGFNRGVPTVPLPTNSYGQQNAALGMDPSITAAPTNYEIRECIPELADNSNTVPDGIYIPNTGSLLAPQVTGGIYVHGDLDRCRVFVDSLGRQVYRLNQGSTTKTITVDRTLNLTIVDDGSLLPKTYVGTPRGVLYAKGDITDLGGPDRVNGVIQPALANGTELLIAGAGDITLERDMTYQDYDRAESVLGIYTNNGDILIGSNAPNDMHLDAYVMAAGPNGEFRNPTYDSTGPRGTFHLRGGMVTDCYGVFYRFNQNGDLVSGYARDFRYDRRGLAPPYYPTTMRFVANQPTGRTVSWKEL